MTWSQRCVNCLLNHGLRCFIVFFSGGRGFISYTSISYHHDIPMTFRWYPIVYHYIIFVSLPVLTYPDLSCGCPRGTGCCTTNSAGSCSRIDLSYQRQTNGFPTPCYDGYSITTGWWFGTWILFSHILGIGNFIIHLTTVIFFRGVGQPPIWQSKRVWFPDCNAITWRILSGHNCQTQWIQWHWGPQDSWVGL